MKQEKPFRKLQMSSKKRFSSNSKSEKFNIPSIASATVLEKNYINVKINDLDVKALVDSGSDLCCINKSLLKKFGIMTIDNSVFKQVRGISGKTIHVKGTVNLNIMVGDSSFPQKFHVFDNIHHSLIIGHDFLKTNKCKLNYDTLQFETGVPSLQSLSTFKVGLARLTGSVTLQPLSETLVPVRLSRIGHDGVGIVEPIQSIFEKNVALARAVVRSDNGRASCKLLNPLPFEVTLKSRMVVGKLLPVDESSIRKFAFCEDDMSEINGKEDGSDVCVNSLSEVYCDEVLNRLGISADSSVLTTSQKLKLKEFIVKNEDMFATDTSQLGCTSFHSHNIETGDAPPQRQNPYRTSPQVKREIENHTKDLLNNDIIEPSDSMWSSPVIMCKKKDGTFRMAIDYRRLNAVTKPINFPLPRFEDVVDSVAENNSKIFSVLDLRSGFHQIPLDPETKHKTTFVTHEGSFNFKRLPYGLRNAPIAFQTVMAHVLRGINFKFALVYVDDIMIHSSNFDQHLQHLQIVFDRLREADLKLQPKKCKFAADRVEYLGHYFSNTGIEVNPDKIEAVKSFPKPKTQKNVRAFLGLCNYYRKFIAGFSELAGPLNDLLKKDKDFEWSEACEKSFRQLKDR